MTEYDTAVDFHQKIEALYPAVERHGAFFRRRQPVGPNVPLPPGTASGVDSDRVFCALSIKAATTKRAVFTLCEAGDGDNAMALARVVLENAFLMHWMLGGTGRDRLETYVLFMSVLHEQTIEMLAKHFQHHPDVVESAKKRSDPYNRAIARSVFGNNRNTWAYFPVGGKRGKLRQVRIAEMFRQVDAEFAYEGPYATGSQLVHSGPESLYGILPELLTLRRFMLVTMPSTRLRGTAMSFSNAAMLTALQALDEYVGLGLSAQIEDLAAAWKAYAKSTFDEQAEVSVKNGTAT